MPKIPPINRRPLAPPQNAPFETPPPPPDDTSKERSRKLRAEATPAERVLWASLRNLKSRGYHFRRQARIDPFIADFACKLSRLIVELDGAQHGYDDARRRDEARTAYLRSEGYRVVRFWNHEVFENRDGVIDAILRALGPHPIRASHGSTSPNGGGGTEL